MSKKETLDLYVHEVAPKVPPTGGSGTSPCLVPVVEHLLVLRDQWLDRLLRWEEASVPYDNTDRLHLVQAIRELTALIKEQP